MMDILDKTRESDKNEGRIEKGFPEWISVNDKLPFEFVNVLTYTDSEELGTHIHVTFRFSRYLFENGREWFGIKGNVTHWMPLPEPPREEA